MIEYIFALVLIILVLIAIELRKNYHSIPRKELKYRAVHGDQLAERLYRAASYDSTLELFLWLIIVLGTAGSLVLFSSVAPLLISFIAIVLTIWLAFAWLPKTKSSLVGGRITLFLTPLIASLLSYLHPLVSRLSRSKSNNHQLVHTRLYDKDDLVGLINKQRAQPDSRISDRELEIIKNSLQLFETKVGPVCLGWSKVKTATSSDPIGPILLDELHKSKQVFIPVFDDEQKDSLIGVLNLNKLNLSSTGIIGDAMETTVYFINEDDHLADALQAFSATNSSVLFVVDAKERFVGLLTLVDVISRLHDSNLSSVDRYSSITKAANKSPEEDHLELEEDEIMSISI
jgi:CBS domain containing-hemolysin-like protein